MVLRVEGPYLTKPGRLPVSKMRLLTARGAHHIRAVFFRLELLSRPRFGQHEDAQPARPAREMKMAKGAAGPLGVVEAVVGVGNYPISKGVKLI